MREDCTRYAQQCKQCQQHADWHKAPPKELRLIYSPWPFHTWGINILGHFPLAVRQMKYLMAAIEYFTKWIEAEPVAHITAHKVQHFVWKNIVCPFGISKRLLSDNGTQFASQHKAESETGVRVSKALLNERTGQPSSAQRIEKKARQSQGDLGRRSS